MRASRLLSILIQLQLHGQMRAEALAQALEVSVRTIHRDIDELSAAGVPVYAERGRAGGFRLHEGYRLMLTGLSPAEARALLLAGAGDAAADLGDGAEAGLARLKLLASLPEAARAGALLAAERVHIDPVDWYRRAETHPDLPALAAAVWQGRTLELHYDSWQGPGRYRLDPLGLVLKGGHWYLVALRGGAPRVFRVARIRAAVVHAALAQRPAGFDLGAFWRGWAADFEARLLDGHARLRLTGRGLNRLRDLLPAAVAGLDASLAPDDEAWIETSIAIETGRHGIRLLLALGADCEVLGPPELRTALHREAESILQLYA